MKNKYKIISYAKKDDPQYISVNRDNENIDDDNSEFHLVLYRSKKELWIINIYWFLFLYLILQLP